MNNKYVKQYQGHIAFMKYYYLHIFLRTIRDFTQEEKRSHIKNLMLKKLFTSGDIQ